MPLIMKMWYAHTIWLMVSHLMTIAVGLRKKNMNLNDKITELYKQYSLCTSPKKKKDLYKAIKRAEGQRRKEKLEKEGVIV